MINKDLSFYKGKRILVTGNTGFKGSWMCRMLLKLGAQVTGYALKPPTTPPLFALCGLQHDMHTLIGDIRDWELLQTTFHEVQP